MDEAEALLAALTAPTMPPSSRRVRDRAVVTVPVSQNQAMLDMSQAAGQTQVTTQAQARGQARLHTQGQAAVSAMRPPRASTQRRSTAGHGARPAATFIVD